MTCRACASSAYLCDCNQLGIIPPPARNGADTFTPVGIGPDRSPNRHGARRTTRPFLRPSALTKSVNPISKQEVSQ
ncbi:hypothetical protein GCM10007897_43730 [Sphingobium jiangsuense]|nr:hypothetical protein GCM10007897_43730 [Sphingobium jiangsuense]